VKVGLGGRWYTVILQSIGPKPAGGCHGLLFACAARDRQNADRGAAAAQQPLRLAPGAKPRSLGAALVVQAERCLLDGLGNWPSLHSLKRTKKVNRKIQANA
jgi:hypothetical protein